MEPALDTLRHAIIYFSDAENCREYLVARRWPDGVECPRCSSKNVKFLEKYNRWQCSARHDARQFTSKTGTIFEDSPLGIDKWLVAMWQVVNCKNGVSSYEVHRAIGVTQKTAWFMDRRIRHALTMGTINKISGRIEADETFIGGKARNMHADKRQRLLRRILASRNSIEESRGILSESYPLIREARER
jgi:transposase-like protein